MDDHATYAIVWPWHIFLYIYTYNANAYVHLQELVQVHHQKAWSNSFGTPYHPCCLGDHATIPDCHTASCSPQVTLTRKNKVPGIWAGPRCCHFSNILQEGPQNAEKRNLSIRSNFVIIIIICMLIILDMALCQTYVCKSMRTYSSIAWGMCASAWERTAA